MLFDTPEGNSDRYDAVRERLGISNENPPEGAILHIAGAGPNGGWRVVEVWESTEHAQKFAREVLEPALRDAGIERPAPQVWPVHNLMQR